MIKLIDQVDKKKIEEKEHKGLNLCRTFISSILLILKLASPN